MKKYIRARIGVWMIRLSNEIKQTRSFGKYSHIIAALLASRGLELIYGELFTGEE